MSIIYALPNAARPTLLIKASALQREPEMARRLLRSCKFADGFHGAYQPHIVDAMFAMGGMNYLLRPYLVDEARLTGASWFSDFALNNDILAKIFSVKRDPVISTTFVAENGRLYVAKEPFLPSTTVPKCSNRYFLNTGYQEAWSPGIPEEEILEKFCLEDKWNSFESEILKFIHFVFDRFPCDETCLDGRAIDALTRNATNESGQIHLFDLEYMALSSIRKSYYVLRLCLHMFSGNKLLFRYSPYKSVRDMYEHFCGRLSITPSLAEDVEEESSFMRFALKEDVGHGLSIAVISKSFTSLIGKHDLRASVKRYKRAMQGMVTLSVIMSFLCVWLYVSC